MIGRVRNWKGTFIELWWGDRVDESHKIGPFAMLDVVIYDNSLLRKKVHERKNIKKNRTNVSRSLG